MSSSTPTNPTALSDKLAERRAAQQSGQAVAQRQGKPSNVLALLNNGGFMRELAALLSSEEMAKRFMRVALTECQRNRDLFECSWESFAGALMLCAQLNLEPGPAQGLAWLLPFNDNKRRRKVCTFVLGYGGIIQLGMRSSQVHRIAGIPVHTTDEFDYEESALAPRHRRTDLDAARRDKPIDRGPAYAFYFLLRYANGGVAHDLMTRRQVERHRDRYSKAKDNGPWVTNFDEMARVTVVRRNKRVVPASPDWILGTNAHENGAVWEPGVQMIEAENLLQLGEREDDEAAAADPPAPVVDAQAQQPAAAASAEGEAPGQMKLGEDGDGR
jgi:recombination protein RecT